MTDKQRAALVELEKLPSMGKGDLKRIGKHVKLTRERVRQVWRWAQRHGRNVPQASYRERLKKARALLDQMLFDENNPALARRRIAPSQLHEIASRLDVSRSGVAIEAKRAGFEWTAERFFSSRLASRESKLRQAIWAAYKSNGLARGEMRRIAHELHTSPEKVSLIVSRMKKENILPREQ
jgi:hypothetical protein